MARSTRRCSFSPLATGMGAISRQGFEVGLGAEHLHHLDPLSSLKKELVAVFRERQSLHDRRENADLDRSFGSRVVLVASDLAECRDQVLILGKTLQQRTLRSMPTWSESTPPGKQHRRDERDDGKRLGTSSSSQSSSDGSLGSVLVGHRLRVVHDGIGCPRLSVETGSSYAPAPPGERHCKIV
jgi:hypothetical protein